MAAVHLYAAGGIVAVAGPFPSKLQRLLWTGFLRRSFLSGIDGVVAAPRNDDRHGYSAERLLLSSTGSQRLHAGEDIVVCGAGRAGAIVFAAQFLAEITRGRTAGSDSVLPYHQHGVMAV